MANAYSESHVNNNYIQPVNLNLINTVLASKQQKYNANVAKIDSVIETYAKVDLIRDKDKQMLYENINNVITNFEGVSKMSLTNTDTIRQIEQSFNTSITPYLAEQMANTARIRKFMGDVGTIKEKKADKYSDINVNYALQKAGLEEYQNGTSDTLGKLEYTEYVDVQGESVKQLNDFAKNYGVETFSELQGMSEGQLLQLKVQGERLTKERISDFLNTTVFSDPKIVKQMEINSWATYGGMSDEAFTEGYKKSLQMKANELDLASAQINTKMKALSSDSDLYKRYEQDLKQLKSNKLRLEDIVNSEAKLDRDKVGFEVYKNNFVDGIASSFSFERIKDMKWDDSNLKVAEYYRKLENDKFNREIKTEELAIKRAGVYGSGVAGIESEITLKDPNDTSREGKTSYTLATEDYDKSFENVRQALIDEDPSFSGKSKKQQDSIINTIMTDNLSSVTNIDGKSGSVNGYGQAVKEAVAMAKKSKGTIDNYSETVFSQYSKLASENYDEMLRNLPKTNLNIERLKVAMPTFATNLQRGLTFEQLPKNRKDAIMYEYYRNANASGAVGAEDRQATTVMEAKLRANLEKNKDNNRYLQKLDSYYRGKDNLSTVSGITEPIVAGIYGALGVGAELLETLGDTAVSLFGTEDRLKRRLQDNKRKTNQFFTSADEALSRSGGFWSGVFTTDEDLNSLNRNNMSFTNPSTGTSENFNEQFNRKSRAIRDTYLRPIEDAYGRQVQSVSQVSFSKDVKADAPYVNAINAVASSEGKTLSKNYSTYNMTVNPDTKEYEFSVVVESKERDSKGNFKTNYEQDILKVPATKVPEILRNRLTTTSLGFSQSESNPNRSPEKVKVSMPTNIEQKEVILDKFSNPEVRSRVEVLYQTPSERMNSISRLVKNEKQRQQLNSLYSSNYEVTYIGSAERGFVPYIKTPEGDIPSRAVRYSDISNEYLKTLNSLTVINDYIQNKQKEYLTNE